MALPLAQGPSLVPRGGGSCCPVYWALTIELCGLEHPAVCLRPTPAPARASLHPHPEPGSSPGPAKEASWTGRGACHTHAARGWLCASGMREARVMAAGPAPAAPALPPGTSTSNCSNRPRCLLIAIATAAHVLLGGGRPAWRAGGQKGIWLRQAVYRFSPTWAPHPAACKAVKPLFLETSLPPHAVPLRAPSSCVKGRIGEA